MRRLLAALSVLLVLTISLSACTGTKSTNTTPTPTQPEVKKGPNGEVYGGTYKVAIGSEPAGIDPQIDTTLQVYNLSRNIFSTLIRYKGASLDLEPELLAEMPRISADGKTYSFKLKDGVQFSDGTKLTAKDVKFTFERMLNPATKAKNAWVFEEIAGAKEMLDSKATELSGFKLTGDLTFDITLARPFPPFLQNLATPPASIFSADYTTKAGAEFQRKPMGTGPFKLAEWKPNELLVLEKNPTYFEKGVPFLDKVQYRVIKEEATRWLEFEQGNTDEAGIPTAEFQTATKSGKWTVMESVPLNTYYLSLNMDVFKDKRVREAVSLGIDRQKILTAILMDKGTVAKQFVTPGIPGALTSAPGFKFDPARAKQLLQEAGATNLKIESWQRGGDKVSDTNLAIQGMLKEIGINYEVKIADSATYRDARGKGKIPANYGNWWADYPDPDNYLYTFFHSKSSTSYSVNYKNADVDKILDEARALTDDAKRAKMYQDLETKLLYEEYAIIPLFHQKDVFLTQKHVHGIVAHPTGVTGVKTVWKDAGK